MNIQYRQHTLDIGIWHISAEDKLQYNGSRSTDLVCYHRVMQGYLQSTRLIDLQATVVHSE